MINIQWWKSEKGQDIWIPILLAGSIVFMCWAAIRSTNAP